jgi:hypothetical protein
MKDHKMRKKAIFKIGRILCREFKETCLSKNKSIFKDKSPSAIESFDWTNVVNDLRQTAPNLVSLLEASIGNQESKQTHISVVMTAGLLLRCYSQRCNLLQRVFSILLYASNAPKQVSCV